MGGEEDGGQKFSEMFQESGTNSCCLSQNGCKHVDEETRKPRNRMDCLKSPISMPILPIPVNKPPRLTPSYAMRSNRHV